MGGKACFFSVSGVAPFSPPIERQSSWAYTETALERQLDLHVLNDHRGSLRLENDTVSAAEVESWRCATSSFTSVAPKRRASTALASKPRVASRDFLLALERSLENATGYGLTQFASSLVDMWPLRKLVVMMGIEPKAV
eukprot:3202573-Amphidinium_carterae.4